MRLFFKTLSREDSLLYHEANRQAVELWAVFRVEDVAGIILDVEVYPRRDDGSHKVHGHRVGVQVLVFDLVLLAIGLVARFDGGVGGAVYDRSEGKAPVLLLVTVHDGEDETERLDA